MSPKKVDIYSTGGQKSQKIWQGSGAAATGNQRHIKYPDNGIRVHERHEKHEKRIVSARQCITRLMQPYVTLSAVLFVFFV
jgi:ribosomal protein L16/L10AE